jgi:hypothetical protein
MLQRLFRKLVRGQVIFLVLVHSGNAMCVGGKLVEFGRSLVRITWHGVFLWETISYIREELHILAADLRAARRP